MSLDHLETIGERLQRLRETKGIGLNQLADGLLSPEMLLLIEHNMGVPSNRVLDSLATRLGVTVDYFQETKNRMRKKRLWEQIGKPVSIEGHTAILFQHVLFPQQWLFNGNIVLANQMREAVEKLTEQARLLKALGYDSYWKEMSWRAIVNRRLL